MLFTRPAPDGGRDLIAVQARNRTVITRRPGHPADCTPARDPRAEAQRITARLTADGWSRQPSPGGD